MDQDAKRTLYSIGYLAIDMGIWLTAAAAVILLSYVGALAFGGVS